MFSCLFMQMKATENPLGVDTLYVNFETLRKGDESEIVAHCCLKLGKHDFMIAG